MLKSEATTGASGRLMAACAKALCDAPMYRPDSLMLLEAALSFLGFGVQPPMSSLGVLIDEGAKNIEEFPWLLIFLGLVFSFTLFSLNFFGDGFAVDDSRHGMDPAISAQTISK